METILNFLIEVINNNWKEEVNKKISSQICSCFSREYIYREYIGVNGRIFSLFRKFRKIYLFLIISNYS